MSDFSKEWGDEFNKCCVPLTGRASKNVPEQDAVVKGTAALSGSLSKIDKSDPSTIRAGKEKVAAQKAVEKELKTYKSAAAKYKKLVDAALKVTPKTEKDAYRALKKLAAHLDFITAKVEHHITTLGKESIKAADKANERVIKETEAARKKGMSDGEVKEEVDYAKQLKSLSQFPTAMASAYTKAKVTVQAIKSDPSVATYNKQMEAGGRNYTQQIGNLVKLSKDSKCPGAVKTLLKGVERYKGALDAYGNGERRSVAADTSEKDVLLYLKGYAKVVKETYPYAEKMIGFMKKHKLK